MTVFGWDASDFDWPRGPMDLAAARAAGVEFFTHKATENTNVKHVRYGEALNRARAAGVTVLGAYHVVRSPANAAAEVDYFLAYVNQQTPWWKDHPYWFWQVDLEKWPYDSVPASEGEAFADIVQARTGRPAIIYASKGQYGDQLRVSDHHLWNANYGSNPTTTGLAQAYAARGGDGGPGWATYSGRAPVFWQFGSRVTIGRQPICDANAFRGTLDDLKRLINPNGGDMAAVLPLVDGDGPKNGLYHHVWRLQSDLANAGYDPGPLDGVYGAKTAAALVAAGVCGGDKTGKTYGGAEDAGLQRLLSFAYARQAIAQELAKLPATLKGEKGDPGEKGDKGDPGLAPGDRIVSVVERAE